MVELCLRCEGKGKIKVVVLQPCQSCGGIGTTDTEEGRKRKLAAITERVKHARSMLASQHGNYCKEAYPEIVDAILGILAE